MESLRLGNVAFCGENPNIVLYKPGTETVSAAISYWECTFSAHGEGHMLLVYFDAENAAALGQPQAAVFADNVPLARFLTDELNQHFDDWKDLGVGGVPVTPARFFKESDSRHFLRLACHADESHIDLRWDDVRDRTFRTFPDLFGGVFGLNGDEHYDVANVIALCGQGSIAVNGHEAAGEPQVLVSPNGRLTSSVFLALCETWIRA